MAGVVKGGRGFIVHDLAQMKAALRAGRRLCVPVLVRSAWGASAFGGAAWFKALIEQAQSAVPEARACFVLHCGVRAGDVMAALRLGVKSVAFEGEEIVAVKLRALAGAVGGELRDGDRNTRWLDLAETETPAEDLDALCCGWLGGGGV